MKINESNIDLLVIALSKGDRKAFENIYRMYFPMLFNLCHQFLNDPTFSEEMIQESFMKLWERRRNLSTRDNIRNMLYTICKNKCLNYLRDKKTMEKHYNNINRIESELNYTALSGLGEFTEFNELNKEVQRAIQNLPETIKYTFLLSRHENLKYKEIALKEDISIKTVEARISKALQILKKDLKDFLS